MSLTESPGSPWFKDSKAKANDPANDLPSKPRKVMLFDLVALDGNPLNVPNRSELTIPTDPSKTFEQDREDILLSNGLRNQRESLALDTLRYMNDGDSSPIPGSGFILDKMKSPFVKANTTRTLKEIGPKTTTSLPRGSESAKNKPKTALKLPTLGQFPDPTTLEKATPKANAIVPPKRIYTQNERTRSKETKESQLPPKYSKGSFISPKPITIGEELYNPDKVFTPSSENNLSDIKTPTVPKSIKLLNDIRESSPNEEADAGTAQTQIPMIIDLIQSRRTKNSDEFAMRLQLPRPKRMSRTMNEIPEHNHYRTSKAENENNSLPKIEDSPENPVSRQKERRKSREKSTERPKRNFIMELLQEYANDNNRAQSPEMFQSLLRLEPEFKEIREEKPDSPKKYNRKKKRIGLGVFTTKNQDQPIDIKESPKNINEDKLRLEVRAIKPKLKIKIETNNNINVKPPAEKSQTGFHTTRNTSTPAQVNVNASNNERIHQQNLLAKGQRRIAMHGFNVFKFNLNLQNSPINKDIMGSAPNSARNSIENATNRHMAHIRNNSIIYKEKKTLRPPLLYTNAVLKEREKENRANGTTSTGIPLEMINPVIGIKKLFPLPPSYMDVPAEKFEPRGMTTSRGKAKNEESSSGEEKNYSRRTNSMLYASDFVNENEGGGGGSKLSELKNIEQRPKSFYIPKIGSRVAAN